MSSAPRDRSPSRRRRFLSSTLLAALALLLVLPEAAGQTPRKAATTLPLRVARPASGAHPDRADEPSSLARHEWKWKDHHEAEREEEEEEGDHDHDHDHEDHHGHGHGPTGTPTPTVTGGGGGFDGPTGTPTPTVTGGGGGFDGPTGTPTPTVTGGGGGFDGPTGTPTPTVTGGGGGYDGPTGTPTPTVTGGGGGIPHSEDSEDTDMKLSDGTLVDRVCDPSASAEDAWLAVLAHADANGDGALEYSEFRALVAKSMGSSWDNASSSYSSDAHLHETKRPTRAQSPTGVAPRPGSAVRASSGRKGKRKDPLRREWVCDANETVEDKVRALFDAMDESERGDVGFGEGDDDRLRGTPFLVSMVTMQYLANALE
jgi:hypothetical protein